jgi:metal-responsive CopG/Arc/MetJ family transcriptional regulator
MGATVKTAISIDKVLYEQAEALAQEMNVPRSQVFTIALEQYLRRRQGQQLLEQINRAYASERDRLEPDGTDYEAAEQQQLQHASRSFRRLLEEEW